MNLNDYEFATEVKVFKIKKKCPIDICEGELLFNNKVRPLYPQEYGHSCSNCQIELYFPIKYPTIRYEEI